MAKTSNSNSHMALSMGRPRLVNMDDCTITEPIDCNFPQAPAFSLYREPGPTDRPSSYTLQLVKYRIGQQIHRAMSLGLFNNQRTNRQVIQNLHLETVEMLRGLPPSMRLDFPDRRWDMKFSGIVKQRLQISIVANAFLMALHKPHTLADSFSRQAAVDAGLTVLDASHRLFLSSEKHHYKIYTLMFYTIEAGILLSAVVMKDQLLLSNFAGRTESALSEAVMRLGLLKESNTAAVFGEQVLGKCLRKIQQAIEAVEQIRTKSTGLVDSTSQLQHMRHDMMNNVETVNNAIKCSNTPLLAPPQSNSYETFNNSALEAEILVRFVNTQVPTLYWLEQLDTDQDNHYDYPIEDFAWNSLFD